MAISVDSTSSKIVQTDVTGSSWAHTVTAGSTLLIIGAAYNIGPPSVTWNSSAATLVTAKSVGGSREAALYYVLNPTTGSHEIKVSGFSNGYFTGYGVSLSGTSSGILATAVGATGASTTASVNAGGETGDLVVDMVVWNVNGGSTTVAGAGQTAIVNSGGAWSIGGGSYEQAGSTTTTMSWTLQSNMVGYAIVAVAVRAAAAAAAPPSGGISWWY